MCVEYIRLSKWNLYSCKKRKILICISNGSVRATAFEFQPLTQFPRHRVNVCRFVDRTSKVARIYVAVWGKSVYAMNVLILFNAIHVHYAFDSNAYENFHGRNETTTQSFNDRILQLLLSSSICSQHYECIWMSNHFERSLNARDVIVMRWPHGMQVAVTTHTYAWNACVRACLFSFVVCVCVVDKHFGSLTFKLHAHFPLSIYVYNFMFMDRTRQILLIHFTHSTPDAQNPKYLPFRLYNRRQQVLH